MADDIKENAMSGGTPARLRGLAANGNSISPTLEEVMNEMGIHTYSFTLAAKEEKDLGDLGYGMYLLASPNNSATAIFALVPIQKVLCQMQVQIFTVIIQMGLKVLLSVEKRQMVAFLSKTTEALTHEDVN